MRINSITIEAVIFFSACSVEALNFTLWSCSLKIGYDRFFKAAIDVSSRRKSIRLRFEMPTRIKTDRHGLTHRVWI